MLLPRLLPTLRLLLLRSRRGQLGCFRCSGCTLSMLGLRSRSRDLEWLLSMCSEELEPKSVLAAPGESQQPEVEEGTGDGEAEEMEEQREEEEAELLRCRPGGLEALATDGTGTTRDSI